MAWWREQQAHGGGRWGAARSGRPLPLGPTESEAQRATPVPHTHLMQPRVLHPVEVSVHRVRVSVVPFWPPRWGRRAVGSRGSRRPCARTAGRRCPWRGQERVCSSALHACVWLHGVGCGRTMPPERHQCLQAIAGPWPGHRAPPLALHLAPSRARQQQGQQHPRCRPVRC